MNKMNAFMSSRQESAPKIKYVLLKQKWLRLRIIATNKRGFSNYVIF